MSGETWWGETEAGSDMAQGEDPREILMNVGVPDWVGVPPELGGGRFRVERAFRAPCPLSGKGVIEVKETDLDKVGGCGGDVRHLQLKGTGLRVAECPVHKFVWYKRKRDVDA